MIVIEGEEMIAEGLLTKTFFDLNNQQSDMGLPGLAHITFKAGPMIPVSTIKLGTPNLNLEPESEEELTDHYLVRKYLSGWISNKTYRAFVKHCTENELYGILYALDHGDLQSFTGSKQELKKKIIDRIDKFVKEIKVDLTVSVYSELKQRPSVAYHTAIEHAKYVLARTRGGSRIALEGYNKLETGLYYMAVSNAIGNIEPLFAVRIAADCIAKFKLALLTGEDYPVEDMEISINDILVTPGLSRFKKLVENEIFAQFEALGVPIKVHKDLGSEIYNTSRLLVSHPTLAASKKAYSEFIEEAGKTLSIIGGSNYIDITKISNSHEFKQKPVNVAELEQLIEDIFERLEENS